MLADGALDAVMAARRPSCFVAGHPKVSRLFPDYRAAERDYYRKTGIFPIMHAVGVRRDVHEKHPWLAASVYKAFAQAKRLADAEFAETTALKIGLPWVNAEYDETRALMGDDYWSYGLNEPNRRTLDAMARYSFEQGLAVRLLSVDEMFAESTLRRRHAGLGGSHASPADLLLAQPADDDRHRGIASRACRRSSSASSTAAPRRCTSSIPTSSWCSGPTISTASSTR